MVKKSDSCFISNGFQIVPDGLLQLLQPFVQFPVSIFEIGVDAIN